MPTVNLAWTSRSPRRLVAVSWSNNLTKKESILAYGTRVEDFRLIETCLNRQTVQLAQEQMGQMSQAKTILASVDAKLSAVDAKLDTNDVEKDTLQVFFKKYILCVKFI